MEKESTGEAGDPTQTKSSRGRQEQERAQDEQTDQRDAAIPEEEEEEEAAAAAAFIQIPERVEIFDTAEIDHL